MRNFTALCLAALLLLILPACSAGTQAPAAATPSPVPVERTETVTVPADVIDRCDLDMHAAARRLNLPDTTENIDGSYTIRLTVQEKEALASSVRQSLQEQLDALPENGDWPFLLQVELSGDFCSVTLSTEADRYSGPRDRTVAEAVYLPTLLCLALCSEETEDFTQTFTVVDENGETIDTFIYPEPEPSPEAEPSAAE